ncbi:MAG: hypothetical protein OXG25_10650 [Gammaproteobacteria bacterium]|nr:hypothetical protein [Gammaproteobacteria bacterium]
MKITRLFQRTMFGIFFLFLLIGVSTSVVSIYSVDLHLTSEYEENSRDIAKTIADASVDIILNRDLSSLQSLIDQFVEIQGISYIYIVNDTDEYLAHTFVPGIPEEILESERQVGETVTRNLAGMGDFVEVSSYILAGHVGSVHIGMDVSHVALAIQQAIGNQIYLIAIIFFVGIFASIWFVSFAAKPINSLLDYAVILAKGERQEDSKIPNEQILTRNDEVGHLARLFQYFSTVTDTEKLEKEPEVKETK